MGDLPWLAAILGLAALAILLAGLLGSEGGASA